MEGHPIRTNFRTTTRTLITSTLAVVIISSPLSSVAFADTYDDQIKALQLQAQQQQAQADQLRGQATTYAAKRAELEAQNSAIQLQISASQAKFNQVTAEVAAAETKMSEQKSSLGANLKSMYLDSGVSPIEMIASSKNLSEYFNQQEYKDAIKNKIQSSLTEIQALKTQLEDQKTQLTNLLADQRSQQSAIQANRNEVARLQAIASNNAAAADNAVKQSNAETVKLRAQQAAVLAARLASQGGGGKIIASGSCGGGYPDKWCRSGMDTLVDSWGMYNRECVSYTAYKVYASGRNMPYWGGRGNAKQWPANARAAGIPVDDNPRVGDVAITYAGTYGHAMYVEAVSGNKITVSQYNYDNQGNYSMMTVPATFADEFIHF